MMQVDPKLFWSIVLGCIGIIFYSGYYFRDVRGIAKMRHDLNTFMNIYLPSNYVTRNEIIQLTNTINEIHKDVRELRGKRG